MDRACLGPVVPDSKRLGLFKVLGRDRGSNGHKRSLKCRGAVSFVDRVRDEIVAVRISDEVVGQSDKLWNPLCENLLTSHSRVLGVPRPICSLAFENELVVLNVQDWDLERLVQFVVTLDQSEGSSADSWAGWINR